MKNFTVLILVLAVFTASCKRDISLPNDIETVLELAGDNRQELKKVIDYYSSSLDDSLKLKAAIFLIRNLDGLKTLDTSSLNSNQIYLENLNNAFLRNKRKNDITTISMTIDSVNLSNNLHPTVPPTSFFNEINIIKSDF